MSRTRSVNFPRRYMWPKSCEARPGRSPMDSKYASTSSNRIALSATLPSSATLRGTSPSSAKPRARVKFAATLAAARRLVAQRHLARQSRRSDVHARGGGP